MKYREDIIQQLKKQPFFTKEAFSQLASTYSLKNSTISSYLVRSVARKDIVQLKRGFYVTSDFYLKYKNNSSYLFYLANVLRGPSYVSSWTALQHYNLTTEIIGTITSVAEKVTRDFKTKIGTFSYQSIKKDFFSDFVLKKDVFEYYIATPAKALFDLLYFKTNQFRGVTFQEINSMIESLRIDIDEMDKVEREKFYAMVKKKYE